MHLPSIIKWTGSLRYRYIGNTYLEAKTEEKVCIKAGPEFGEIEGQMLIIVRALYGLRLSGGKIGDLLATCLI